MSDSVAACEADIVARLQAQMPYLASCSDVGDARTAFELEEIVTPAVRIMFAGDSAQAPMSVGIPRQLTRLRWQVFLIATSFSPSIEGRRDLGTEKGIVTMRFDVATALRGFALPSQAPFVSKLWRIDGELWSIGESSVVFVDRWYNDVIETGSA